MYVCVRARAFVCEPTDDAVAQRKEIWLHNSSMQTFVPQASGSLAGRFA